MSTCVLLGEVASLESRRKSKRTCRLDTSRTARYPYYGSDKFDLRQSLSLFIYTLHWTTKYQRSVDHFVDILDMVWTRTNINIRATDHQRIDFATPRVANIELHNSREICPLPSDLTPSTFFGGSLRLHMPKLDSELGIRTTFSNK